MEEKKKFFDADFRKEPKTKIFCAYCQRDLNPANIRFFAYLNFKDAPEIFNPKLISKYKSVDGLQMNPIGSECVKHIGREWVIEVCDKERKMSWEDCKIIENRIIEKNKKEISSFKEGIIRDIQDLEIGLSMGGYLSVQDEVPIEVRREVIRERNEMELNDAEEKDSGYTEGVKDE